jgi:putative FmdB family regulatory protein
MPTYEYRCPNGHHFELFQRMSEEPRAECPECGSVSERLLSGGAGFLFKGDGFYITDSRSASYKKEASKEGSDGLSDNGKTGDSKGKKKVPPSSGKSEGSKPADSSGGGSSSDGA